MITFDDIVHFYEKLGLGKYRARERAIEEVKRRKVGDIELMLKRNVRRLR